MASSYNGISLVGPTSFLCRAYSGYWSLPGQWGSCKKTQSPYFCHECHGVGERGTCSFFPLTLQSKKLRVFFGAMFGNQQEKFQLDLERDGARGDLGGVARNRLIN